MNQENTFLELMGLEKQFPYLEPLKKLGLGGVCAVFLVMDTTHDRQAALKIMHESIVKRAAQHKREREIVERFHQECRLGVQLPKMGVPRIPEVFIHFRLENPRQPEPVGRPGMVMQYVPGVSLKSVMPVNDRIAIAAMLYQLTESLMHLHRVGVAHGDLTLENAVLDPEGTIWILDFGIARTFGDKWPRVVQDEKPVFGKKGFMAPEIETGRCLMTPESDIYTMAQVTVCLYTGEQPKPDSPLEENSAFQEIPDIVRAVCIEGLRSKPELRPDSVCFFEAVQTLWNRLTPGMSARQYLKSWQSNLAGSGTLVFHETDTLSDVRESMNEASADPEPPNNASGAVENTKENANRATLKNYRLNHKTKYAAGVFVMLVIAVLLIVVQMNRKSPVSDHFPDPVSAVENQYNAPETGHRGTSLSERVLSAAEQGDFEKAAELIGTEALQENEYIVRLIQAAEAHSGFPDQ
jgi:serine/threonine protein kinase